MAKHKEPDTWQFSTVMTATRDGVELFDTLDDMPAVMRARCVRALHSNEAATVLIADPAGRAYLRRIIKEQHAAEAQEAAQTARIYSARLAAELVLCSAAGLGLWLWFVLS